MFKVQLTDLELQDSYYQFSALTEDEVQIFANRYQLMRPYEFPDHVHLQVTFEFDLTLYRVDRDVYSILDWIGDVGGLNEGLYLFFKMILVFFQFNDFQHFLIEKLYTKPPEESGSDSASHLSVSKTSLLRQKINACIPRCLLCKPIRLKHEEKLFEKARLIYSAEVDIIDFLKRIRRLEAFKAESMANSDLTINEAEKGKHDFKVILSTTPVEPEIPEKQQELVM